MNKKVGAIIAIVVLAGIAATVYAKKSSSPSTSLSNNETRQQDSGGAQEFAAAVQSGTPTLCTLTKDGTSMEYLIKGKMMRTNTRVLGETKSDKEVMTSAHMINDTQNIYIWSDDQKQGTKMAVPSEEDVQKMKDQVQAYPSTAPVMSTESDYSSLKDAGYTINCKMGSVSDTDFVPPADVSFIDASAMIRAIPTPDSDGQIDMKKLQEQYGKMMPQNDE